MKYIILIGDGMAGRPLRQLGNSTCLQKAHTPNMDKIASEGEVGMVRTIPPGLSPGSDVAILSIFGYNPMRYYTGRAPLEAASKGIKLGPQDVAYRCNLITLKFPKSKKRDMATVEDYSAGHISTEEARKLIQAINRKLGTKEIIFYPGVSYRHLMVWKGGRDRINSTPPHDITGKKITRYLPSGYKTQILKMLMEKSTEILLSHPVNNKRIERGLNPANSIWLWGHGKKPHIPRFKKLYGLNGALISAVDLVKGIGIYAGFDIIRVKGATGYLDTNYLGKARAALSALKSADIVCVHVEAPDEAAHKGDVEEKIKAIENFDKMVVGTVLKGIKKFQKYRILLLPDHSTPIQVKTHTHEPVPFAIYGNGSRKTRTPSGIEHFSEDIGKIKDIRVFEKGYKLVRYFINST
jgi:2,3-bisphosphoglycerate-independent phosphoglycerate mutase